MNISLTCEETGASVGPQPVLVALLSYSKISLNLLAYYNACSLYTAHGLEVWNSTAGTSTQVFKVEIKVLTGLHGPWVAKKDPVQVHSCCGCVSLRPKKSSHLFFLAAGCRAL